MNRYEIDQLIKFWAMEQAVGQLLLHIKTLTERVAKLE
jgi:hypothetical protein